MTLKDLERKKTQDAAPEKKVDPPGQYQVIYNQPAGMHIPCAGCVLRSIFRLSAEKAHEHELKGVATGRSFGVFVSSLDVVQQKAGEANGMSANGTCNLATRMLNFTYEKI